MATHIACLKAGRGLLSRNGAFELYGDYFPLKVSGFIAFFLIIFVSASCSESPQSLKKLESECTAGNKFSCAKVGDAYFWEKNGQQNYQKAFEAYSVACNGNGLGEGARACAAIGFMYDNGHGVEKNEKIAYDFFKKACDEKFGQGCYRMGLHERHLEFLRNRLRSLLDPVLDLTPTSPPKSARLFQEACRLNSSDGCREAGMYFDELDNFKAVEYFAKSCKQHDAQGCLLYGAHLEAGKGIRQNDSQALESYGKACDYKNEAGCEDYARVKKRLGEYNTLKKLTDSVLNATNSK